MLPVQQTTVCVMQQALHTNVYTALYVHTCTAFSLHKKDHNFSTINASLPIDIKAANRAKYSISGATFFYLGCRLAYLNKYNINKTQL